MGTCQPFGWRGTACSVVTGSRSTRRFSGLPDCPDCRRGVSRSLGSYDLYRVFPRQWRRTTFQMWGLLPTLVMALLTGGPDVLAVTCECPRHIHSGKYSAD